MKNKNGRVTALPPKTGLRRCLQCVAVSRNAVRGTDPIGAAYNFLLQLQGLAGGNMTGLTFVDFEPYVL